MRPQILTLIAFSLVIVLEPAVTAKEPSPITNISIGPDKQVHVSQREGEEFVAPVELEQVDLSLPRVADDHRTAGWLADFDNCCTSYPIPLMLVIYRDGRVIQHFRPGQSIWDWQFLKAGKQVAFWIGPTHGTYTPHFELHDIRSGRLLAQWDGHMKDKHPVWVSGLKAD